MRAPSIRLAVLQPPDGPARPVVRQAQPVLDRCDPERTPGLHLEIWCSAPAGLHSGQVRAPDLLILQEDWFDPLHLDRAARQRTLLDLRLATPSTAWLIGWQRPCEAALNAFDALQIRGTLQCPSDPDTLWRAVCAVLAGELWFPREVLQALYQRTLAARQQPPKDHPDLTRQEQAMLGLMQRGLSPREIGRSLGLSRGRVQRSLAHALDKRALW